MTTYVIEKTTVYDDLTVADLLPYVDARGRLDVRIEGDAVHRPFAVLNLLRRADFLRTHTWVESDDAGSPVALRVTAQLPTAAATDRTAGQRDGTALVDSRR